MEIPWKWGVLREISSIVGVWIFSKIAEFDELTKSKPLPEYTFYAYALELQGVSTSF